MALPLPQTVPNVGPGGGIPTALGALNALSTQNLQNKILGAQAQYAPYTTYADAASKLAYANMLPYQVQATVMSNPMMWMALKDNPDAIKALMSNFQKSIPQGNNIFGNVNMPAPGQQNAGGSGNLLSNFIGDNPLGNLLSQITGGGNQPANNALQSGNLPINGSAAPSNNLTAPPARTQQANLSSDISAVNPAVGGSTAGIVGKETTPYYEQAAKPGENVVNPQTGQVISVASPRTVTATQQQLLAAKRVEPQLDRIADEWSDFMDVPGIAKLAGQKVGEAFRVSPETLKSFGIPVDSNLSSKYAKAKATTLTAPESLVKAYGLNATNETLERLEKVIEPQWGESKESYKNRIMQQLAEIKNEQVEQSKQMLGGGINLTPQANQLPAQPTQLNSAAWPSKKSPINADELEGQMPPKETVWMVRPDGKQVPVHLSNVDTAKQKYNFRGINE